MFTEDDFTRVCCDSRTGFPHNVKCVQKGMKMGEHNVPHGENGTMTHKTGKTANYAGKHRKGEARGTDAQQPDNLRDINSGKKR